MAETQWGGHQTLLELPTLLYDTVSRRREQGRERIQHVNNYDLKSLRELCRPPPQITGNMNIWFSSQMTAC